VLMCGLSDGPLLLHGLAYGMLAMISFSTIVTMLRSRRGRTSIGGPLVLASHLVLLASQVAALGYGAAFKGLAVTPFFLQTNASVWPLAPMVAVLLGLFGFSLMAMEQIIAHNESGARLDALTGLLNRGALDMTAVGLVARWQRDGDPLSCLLFDVDHFKQVNDRYGHSAGDRVLVGIAEILLQNMRASDIVGRWGGEEFLLICGVDDQNDGVSIASKLREAIASRDFPRVGHVTASFGVQQGSGQMEALERVTSRADAPLYQAKEGGRDRVVLYQPTDRVAA